MLIRRNLVKQRQNDLIALKQINEQFDTQQAYPFINYQAVTLSPEAPINSVLISSKERDNKMVQFEKEDSQFSFKQRKILISEQPLVFDEDLPTNQYEKNPQICHQFVKFETKTFEKAFYNKQEQEKSVIKNKSTIGKLINPRIFYQNTTEKQQQTNPIIEQQSETAIKKHLFMSCSRINETLNKIKSLKIAQNPKEQTKSEPAKTQQNQRYSKTVKSQLKFNESTDTSIEEGTPIKKSILNNIRRHVERMSMSTNKKIIPAQQKQESEKHSIIFQLNLLEKKIKKERQDNLESKNRSFLVRSINKKAKKPQSQRETTVISFKTSILQLKELCVKYDQTMKLTVKIPQIFSKLLFLQQDDEEDLYAKAKQILKQLQIYSNQLMTIRKYYNCIIVFVDDIAIISYFSGHIYFGGWIGQKSGLGFQWFPKKFVYYGQFKNNKREGYGILKDQKGNILLGKWRENRYIDQ